MLVTKTFTGPWIIPFKFLANPKYYYLSANEKILKNMVFLCIQNMIQIFHYILSLVRRYQHKFQKGLFIWSYHEQRQRNSQTNAHKHNPLVEVIIIEFIIKQVLGIFHLYLLFYKIPL